MNLFRTVRFIVNHPLNRQDRVGAIVRYLKWQIGSRLVSGPIAVTFVDESTLLVRRGMTGATGNIYCGLHELAEMAFVMHVLRPDDLFVDIGANVGSYSVIASAVVGARTIAIEPVPNTFSWLKRNILINDISNKVTAINICLGDQKGSTLFTMTLDTVNHAALVADQQNVAAVRVETLDAVVGDQNPVLLKIDVEGYETKVIEGALRTILKPSLVGVVMELNGSGSRYGFNEDRLHARMLDAGFKSYVYEPFSRTLSEIDRSDIRTANTIYLRNLYQVQERIKMARRFRVGSTTI